MSVTINFQPESDREDFVQAVAEYEKIWQEDGERIVSMWEKYTGLEFEEKSIDATVIDGMSHSHPLSLRYSLTYDQKKYALIHELGHILLYKHINNMGGMSSLDLHKFMFLVLGQIVKELYGEAFLTDAIVYESNLAPKYKIAWDWALAFSDEEKQKLFKEVLGGNLSVIFE